MSFEALESPKLRSFHRRLTILSAAGMFLDGFDLTVIAVALPFLVKKWAIGPGLSGVVAASAVVGMFFGALLLGHLTDRIGRKAMYVVDLVCFVVFAALTALSQNVWEFIAFRFLLGVGIGADYPISSTLLANSCPLRGAARSSPRLAPAGSSARSAPISPATCCSRSGPMRGAGCCFWVPRSRCW